MKPLRILCREDPVTGIPRLEDTNGGLDPADLRILEEEVHRRFDQVVGSSDGRLFQLEQRHPRLPECFRVFRQSSGRRCPELLLESVQAGEVSKSPPVKTPNPEQNGKAWSAQFLDELAGLLQDDPAFDFVLGDIKAIQRKAPQKLIWILLAGYLHAGHALCRLQGVKSPYLDAARTLQQRMEDTLPAGLLDLCPE